MITLFRPSVSSFADRIEERLKNMVIAHQVTIHENSNSYLLESEKEIEGEYAIHQFLEVLEREMEWKNTLSADACFINPETRTVC